MEDHCTLQLYANGVWRDAASVTLFGPRQRGWQAQTYCAYTLDYAIDEAGRRDAAALAWGQPVGVEAITCATWPPFLVDLLPQGFGRKELLRQLGRSQFAEEGADWELLLAGAANPIGNLRVKEAKAWVDQQPAAPLQGFTQDQVAQRGEDFIEYLARHGLFVAGSSGVQGEWPKLLLTQAEDNLYYLDHALPDARARAHWLVKFVRGTDPVLKQILYLEACYMRLARHLGLRVHADLDLRERALFVRRFDRQVDSAGVVRHAQESLGTLCGLAGFGLAPSHNDACRHLALAATDPLREITEYLMRDIANVALGNKDNHARNTAVQRRRDGTIELTPVFDFAPMFLHPDGIARRMRWEHDDAGSPRWASAIEQVAECTALSAADLTARLRAMAPRLATLCEAARAEGVDESIVLHLRPGIDGIAEQLAGLGSTPASRTPHG